ncbi:hypothetical protein LXL04_009253 [Taraxacum kok-saghyz]
MEFSFDPNLELGLGVASCLITRQVSEHIYEIKIIIIACHVIYMAPLEEDAEGKTKYVVRPYTPISDPDSKCYFDLIIKIYPEGKMSASIFQN